MVKFDTLLKADPDALIKFLEEYYSKFKQLDKIYIAVTINDDIIIRSDFWIYSTQVCFIVKDIEVQYIVKDAEIRYLGKIFGYESDALKLFPDLNTDADKVLIGTLYIKLTSGDNVKCYICVPNISRENLDSLVMFIKRYFDNTLCIL